MNVVAMTVIFPASSQKKQKVRVIGGTGVFTLLVSAQVRSENGKQLD